MRRRAASTLALLILLASPVLAAAALTPATLPTPPGPREAAARLYGEAPLELLPAHDADLAALLPGHALHVVGEASRLPMVRHAMAYDSLTGAALDLTRDLAPVLALALPLGEEGVLRAARAYARLADLELHAQREVVGAADAPRLGVRVEDPRAEPAPEGRWTAHAWTWTPENGVVSLWTLRLGPAGLEEATWRVVALARGDHHAEWESTGLREGVRVTHHYGAPEGHRREAWLDAAEGPRRMSLPEDFDDLPFHVVTERANFDGSRWVAHYPSTEAATTPVGIVEVAKAVAEAGAHAYALQVARNPLPCAGVENSASNWGFESRDPDCTLEVFLLDETALGCIACITGGDHVRIYYAPHAREFLYAQGLFRDLANQSAYDVARTIIGHEHFHNLQYVLTGWDPGWSSYIEGQARFQETVHAPGVNQHPTSGWYVDANGYQRTTHDNLCFQSYRLAPYWGYLYWKDGGIETLRRFLQTVDAHDGQACTAAFAGVLSATLAASPGLHDAHEAALTDLALHAYTRNLTWGAHDGSSPQEWGRHLVEVTALGQQAGSANRTLEPGGIQYVRILPARALTLRCATADAAWSFQVLYRDAAGGVTREPLSCAAPKTIDGAAHARVVVATTRLGPTSGIYLLSVT